MTRCPKCGANIEINTCRDGSVLIRQDCKCKIGGEALTVAEKCPSCGGELAGSKQPSNFVWCKKCGTVVYKDTEGMRAYPT